MNISSSVQQDTFFAEMMYHLAAQEGELVLTQEREMTSAALDQRCRSTIRHAFRRIKKGWVRVLIIAAVIVLLLSTVIAATPVLDKIVGNCAVRRTWLGTEFHMDNSDAWEQYSEGFYLLDHYEITFGYLPDLPLTIEMERRYFYMYKFGEEMPDLIINFALMNGSSVYYNSENAVITYPVIQGRQAELYDHGFAAILVVPWDDMTLLDVMYDGDNAVETVLRVAEELTITYKE